MIPGNLCFYVSVVKGAEKCVSDSKMSDVRPYNMILEKISA